jgi:hypothetical protein
LHGSLETGPVLRVDLGEDTARLGEAALEALERSLTPVPWPKNWDAHSAPFLKTMGVNTWEELERDTVTIVAEEKEGLMSFMPYRSLGPGEGWDVIEEKVFSIPAGSPPEAIGEAVRRALAVTEKWSGAE